MHNSTDKWMSSGFLVCLSCIVWIKDGRNCNTPTGYFALQPARNETSKRQANLLKTQWLGRSWTKSMRRQLPGTSRQGLWPPGCTPFLPSRPRRLSNTRSVAWTYKNMKIWFFFISFGQMQPGYLICRRHHICRLSQPRHFATDSSVWSLTR